MKSSQPYNLPLWPHHTADQKSIDYWVEDLLASELIQSVVNSQAFIRLKDISFLGALDYTCRTKGIEKTERNRADHSLFVAAIANYVSCKRNYSPELTRHLVIAALLHDIGHPPLSHSAEPFIKKTIGYGHHEAGEQIIKGRNSVGHSLFNILSASCDIDFVLSLISGDIDKSEGGDLFSAPINIDTIDGILRSHKYITGIRPSLSHTAVADASFFEDTSNKRSILDEFWKMKERVYSGLINNELGLLSDKTSEYFFIVSSNTFEEEDMYVCESAWKKKHKNLFKELGNIQKNNSAPDWLLDSEFSFTDRQYLIDKDIESESRYKCIKQIKKHKFTLSEMALDPSSKLLF